MDKPFFKSKFLLQHFNEIKVNLLLVFVFQEQFYGLSKNCLGMAKVFAGLSTL
jgi:hypothetical protein